MDQPLKNTRVVNVSLNIPAPKAAARLLELGAEVIKVEPPDGDPMAKWYPDYYQKLCSGQQIKIIDLKTSHGQVELHTVLEKTDLLISSFRAQALQKLGLDWPVLVNQHPRLCMVAIFGYPAKNQPDQPGHDLNFQAEAGLLKPPHLPKVLLADLTGTEKAVTEALCALRLRDQSGRGTFRQVVLSEVAESLGDPWNYGLTKENGLLGGGNVLYGIYPAKDGWIALAALEKHFYQIVQKELQLAEMSKESLSQSFSKETVAYWQSWAIRTGVPLSVVK